MASKKSSSRRKLKKGKKIAPTKPLVKLSFNRIPSD